MNPDIPQFLDLAMQDSRYASQEQQTPPEITSELLSLSEQIGIPPVTTYQTIVLLNTSELDAQGERLFSETPSIQDQEQTFYETHRVIEMHLKKAIDQILSSPEDLPTTIIHNLDQAISTSRNLFRNLTKEGFNSIRPYYQNNQDLPGPSGFYSAAFVVLDTIAIPEFFYDNTPQYCLLPTQNIDSNPYYTTREDVNHITQLKQSGFQVSPNIQVNILAFLKKFRNTHIGHVSKYTPQIIHNEEDGTGSDYNMSTKEFLESKRLATQNSLNNLTVSHE